MSKETRRGRLEIAINILTVIKHGAQKITWIINRTNLCWATYKKYMKFLKIYGYVMETDGQYFTTYKGLKLMNATRQILSEFNE